MIDLSSLLINISIAINHHWEMGFYSLEFQRALASIGMALMYTKLFYWCRLFPQFAMTYRVLYDTIASIRSFMVLLLIVLFAFTNVNIILDSGRVGSGSGGSFMLVIKDNKWFGGLINQWRLGLGDFNTVLYPGENEILVWAGFILATIIT